jgi:hypothetical protein
MNGDDSPEVKKDIPQEWLDRAEKQKEDWRKMTTKQKNDWGFSETSLKK